MTEKAMIDGNHLIEEFKAHGRLMGLENEAIENCDAIRITRLLIESYRKYDPDIYKNIPKAGDALTFNASGEYVKENILT